MLFGILMLAACSSKNGQMTEADAQEAETDSLETDKQERSEYDWANFDIIELADLLVNEKKQGCQMIRFLQTSLDPNSKNIKLQGKGLKGYGEYGFFEIRY